MIYFTLSLFLILTSTLSSPDQFSRRYANAKTKQRACSPQGYLSSLFPELTHRPLAGPADPLGEAAEVVAPVPALQWDFSLIGIMGEERDRLRPLWAAAAAGRWEAVEEMTGGVLSAAEELLGGV